MNTSISPSEHSQSHSEVGDQNLIGAWALFEFRDWLRH